MIKKTLPLLMLFAFSLTLFSIDKTAIIQPTGEFGQTSTQKTSAAINAANVFYPDSIITIDTLRNKLLKTEYKYDVLGNKTSEISFSINSSKTGWIPSNKGVYGYNLNKLIINSEQYTWNTSSNSWEGSSKNEYQFDDLNRCLSNVSYKWNSSTKSWTVSGKNTYQYPGSSKISTDTVFVLDTSTKQFYIYTVNKCTYSTDMQNITVLQSYYDRTNNTWIPQAKCLYSLDQKGNDTLAVVYLWNNTSNTYVFNNRVHSTYESQNKIREFKEGWDYTNETWVFRSDFKYTYNLAGNQTSFERYFWNSSTKEWYGDSKTTNEYDSSGNYLLNYNSYSWSSNAKSWVNKYRTHFNNRADGRCDSTQSFSFQIDKWLPVRVYKYYYKTDQTGISTPTQNKFILYPNPTQNEFKIQGVEAKCNVTIYDLKGKVRFSKSVATNQSVNVSNLGSGTYIVKGDDGHTSFSTKLVVK